MDLLKDVSHSVLKDWYIVGEGSFGTIYRARHTEWKFDVAVKKLHGDVSLGLEELLSEAHKMAVASPSPYVITMFGVLKDMGSKCQGIVMEYMEKGSLDTLINLVKPLAWALKFRIIYEVTLGMNWLHSLSPPLLHLDLKTKNVLLNSDLHVKISDFGLSQFTRSSSSYRNVSEDIGGTPEYMPPEAFQDNYKPSTSTDVYSFAILAAVVLKGEGPYRVANTFLIRKRVCEGDRPCLKSLEDEPSVKCLKEAIDCINCCWSQDKSKRPSFKECCIQWEEMYHAHKCQVNDAVKQVQDEMTTSVAGSSTATSILTVQSSNMTEVIQKFQTLHFMEEPPVMQGAVPDSPMPVYTQQSPIQPQEHTHQTSAKHSYTRQTIYGPEAYPPFHPADYGPTYRNPPNDYYGQTQYMNSPSSHSTSSIIINGCTGAVQIGNNNVLVMTEKSRGQGSSCRPRGPHPVQTSYKNTPTPRGGYMGPTSYRNPTTSRGGGTDHAPYSNPTKSTGGLMGHGPYTNPTVSARERESSTLFTNLPTSNEQWMIPNSYINPYASMGQWMSPMPYTDPTSSMGGWSGHTPYSHDMLRVGWPDLTPYTQIRTPAKEWSRQPSYPQATMPREPQNIQMPPPQSNTVGTQQGQVSDSPNTKSGVQVNASHSQKEYPAK
ncbi:uncharacterized protein WCC33_002309 [Rhinophrynus dorsalis]